MKLCDFFPLGENTKEFKLTGEICQIEFSSNSARNTQGLWSVILSDEELDVDVRIGDAERPGFFININDSSSYYRKMNMKTFDFLSKRKGFLTYRNVPQEEILRAVEIIVPDLFLEVANKSGGIGNRKKAAASCPECGGTGIVDTGFYKRECLNHEYHGE